MSVGWGVPEYLWEMEYLAYLDLWMNDVTDRMPLPLPYEEWRKRVGTSVVEETES